MENVKLEVKGNQLVITVDLEHEGQVSEKGNVRVASTLGNRPLPGDLASFRVGLNIYKPVGVKVKKSK